mmetsp:Transcript_44746/g.93316  ORF Transcript_44746/g.93316 Transcript_44746/m.93316 type:complete len:468 (+) Transcript_44746:62-1465(+)
MSLRLAFLSPVLCHGQIQTRAVPLGMQTATRNGKFLDYRNALRDELHLTLPGANLTLTEVGWHATKRLPAHSLAFVVPPKYVLTVSEALGSGAGHYINANARSLPRTLPRHFVLAMWILQQKHVASVRSLWTRWIAALPPLDRSTLFWSEEELALLDEPRLIASTSARRKALALEYESMVKVLLHEGGMEEDAGDGAITLDEYMWAVCAVTATALHFADDFPVLTPLTLRFKPSAAVETYEYGDESDPGAALYVSASALGRGAELTVGAAMWNDQLMLHAGYLWDDLRVAHTWLRLSGGERSASGAAEAARVALRAEANWTSPQDFALTATEMPSQMLPWLRLALMPASEVAHLQLNDLFEARNISLEREVVRTLVTALDRALGKFEHSIEEDELILDSIKMRKSLPVRTQLAVTYRKLCKQVLLQTRELAELHWESVRSKKSAGGDLPTTSTAKKKKQRMKAEHES